MARRWRGHRVVMLRASADAYGMMAWWDGSRDGRSTFKKL